MARKGFFDFFPPPNFLSMPACGLSVSEDAVRFIRFKQGNHSGSHHSGHTDSHAGGQKMTLSDFAEEKLPSGTIVDGSPAKPDALLVALKKLKQEHKISFANVSLPDDKAYVFRSVINASKDADLRDSVGFILEENIPISPAETVFDFSVVSEDKANSTDEVVVTAIPEETVQSYLDVFNKAGIKVLSFDIEAEAVKRAVVRAGSELPELIVNFTSDKVVLTVVSKFLVQFVSVVNSAADFSVKKLEQGSKENLSESVELVALQNEIKKVCTYWYSGSAIKTKPSNKIKSILVTGNVDPKLDIPSYLAKHLGMNAVLANVWQNAFSLDDTIPPISFDNSLRFSAAIGSAL